MRRGGIACRNARMPIWCREYLLGHELSRSRHPADRPKDRAGKSARTNRRDRLLRDPAARRSRRLPGVVQIVPNDRKDQLGCRDRADDGPAVRRRRRRVRRGDRPGAGGPHRLHAARADRLRSVVLVLHHPVDARDAAAAGRCTRFCRRSTRVRTPAIARSPSPACTSARTAAISPSGRRCWICCRAIERHARGIRFRISSLEPMDCSDDDRRSRRGLDLLRAAFSSSASACERLDARRDAAARTRWRITAGSSIASARRFRTRRLAPTSSSGFLAKRTTTSQLLEAYLRESPITHVHVFPYSDRPGTAAAALTDKVHGSIVRERASVVRAIGRELSQRFHRAQDGTVGRA